MNPQRGTVDTLTGKQRIFKDDYLIHFNATRAATTAGYSNPDKSGPRLLKNPKIQAAIEEALNDLVMTRNEVLRILSSQARAEHTHYYKVDSPEELASNPREDGDPGRIYLAPGIYCDVAAMIADGKQHLIKEIGTNQHGPYIRFVDQQTAVIWTGKHHKLFTEIIQPGRDPELDEALDAINQKTKLDL